MFLSCNLIRINLGSLFMQIDLLHKLKKVLSQNMLIRPKGCRTCVGKRAEWVPPFEISSYWILQQLQTPSLETSDDNESLQASANFHLAF